MSGMFVCLFVERKDTVWQAVIAQFVVPGNAYEDYRTWQNRPSGCPSGCMRWFLNQWQCDILPSVERWII